MTKEQFRKAYMHSITRYGAADSRITKDSGLEHVILDINRRVTIRNKSVWNSKKLAEKAIERYIANGNYWAIDTRSVWRRASLDYSSLPPDWAKQMAEEIRKEYAERLRVIPLREYMVMEHNRTTKG